MKLTQTENLLVDYKTLLSIRQEAKEQILTEAADKQLLIDYSALELEGKNDIQEVSTVSEFFEDKELEI